MSPTSAFAVGQLKQLIFYHLDNEMPDNANFLAGRLHAIEPRNPDASHLLALSYLRLRRPKAAYDYSQKYGTNGRHLGCAYVFALACQELGRYSEGIAALEKARGLWVTRNNWSMHCAVPRLNVSEADLGCHRQAFGDHQTTCSRCCSHQQLTRKAMERPWRCAKGRRLLHRGA